MQRLREECVRISPALLEDYLREFYFSTRYDLGSSGVECWSYGELMDVVGGDRTALDGLLLDDSPSLGAPATRAAVARRWGDGDPDRVIVTHGSTEGLFLAMNALLQPGDEVVTPAPGYHALWSVAEAIGCRLVPWRLPPERGFAPDMDQLRKLITSRTRMVVANFPHNPTGTTLTRSEQAELVDLCRRHGAYVAWDGAFAELVYDGEPLPDPTTWYERALSFGTLSKAYGLPGLRFGWCLAAPDVLAAFLPLRDRLTLCLSPLVETVARQVVEHADRLLKIRLEQARHNRALLDSWVADAGGLVDYVRPAGGVTAFPRFPAVDVDGLCRRLARDHDVLLVPGSCFGRPDRARLGFGGRPALFAEGLARLRDELDAG
jgi:capreomycidine synthase